MKEPDNDSADDQRFFTIEEVAEMFRVNYQLIYRLARSGELPAVRLGRVYRVAKKDLDAYLKRSRTDAAGQGVPGTCSACGKTYASRLSLRSSCDICGEPICFDCASRRGIRRCAEHTDTPDPAASPDST